jgi:hypothetical protein
MIDMEGTHDNEDTDTWQPLSLVTRRLLLRLEAIQTSAVDEEQLAEDEIRNESLVERHVRLPVV